MRLRAVGVVVLLLLGACSESSDGAPFEGVGKFGPANAGIRPPEKSLGDRMFLPDGGRKAFWIRKPEGGSLDLSPRGLTWVKGTLRGDLLEITDLVSFRVDLETEIPTAGRQDSLKVSDLVVTGVCDHMPRVPNNGPCQPSVSAEIRVANLGEIPLECTLERAFVSYSGSIGRAVTDFGITCDRGNGTPMTLAPGAENRAVIALPHPRMQDHGNVVYVTLVFSGGTGEKKLTVRGSAKMSISE
jgi:hypothetical protein